MSLSLIAFSLFAFALLFAVLWVGTQRFARWRTPLRSEGHGGVRRAIDDFLGQRRIALVGLSREEGDFSHVVCRAFEERGIEVVGVNPHVAHIGERRVWKRLQEVPGTLDGALVMTPASEAPGIVRDCVDAGVKRVWLYRGAGRGAVSEEAVGLARSAGLSVVPGACPLMFLEDAAWPHRLHANAQRLVGSFPR